MTIAVSGKSGCGNSVVSAELAKKHRYTLINYTFREYAQEHGLRFADIHALAKKDTTIDKYIDTHQAELSQKGRCVVGSRLSIWKVPDPDLRVYLKAPLWVRAQRIARRENLPQIVSFIRTLVRDRRDRLRYRHYYGIDINDYAFVDLIVDVKKHSVADVIDIISHKIERDGRGVQ